jgi:hypothetical protein
MTAEARSEMSPQLFARTAGLLYLVIIVLGLMGEMVVRANIVAPGDAAATAANIAAAGGLFRMGFLFDSVMFLCDVALAVLLYVLLRPVSRTVALMAMCFRLIQTAVIATNLLHYHAAVIMLGDSGYAAAFGTEELNSLASFFLDLHGYGYDLGLLSFGLSCLLLGYLVYRSRYLPRFIGVLLVAAGFTYLVGSYTRFLFPAQVQAVAPIYVVAIVAELAMCLWLLVRGVNVDLWRAAAST